MTVFLVLLGSGLASCSRMGDRPVRTKCIIQVAQGVQADLDLFTRDPHVLSRKRVELGLPIAGIGYGDAGEIYLQFNDRCEFRVEMARELMVSVFGNAAASFHYQIDGIQPGSHTVDVTGRGWAEESE